MIPAVMLPAALPPVATPPVATSTMATRPVAAVSTFAMPSTRPPGLTSQDLRDIARAAIRAGHPGLSDPELDVLLERVLGGRDVADEARRWRIAQGVDRPCGVVLR